MYTILKTMVRKDIGGKICSYKSKVFTTDLEAYRKQVRESFNAVEVRFTYEEAPINLQQRSAIKLDIRYSVLNDD